MVVYKKATLERIEGKTAVLVLDNGQEMRIAREELRANEVGGRYVVQIMTESESSQTQEVLAHHLLNQLLASDKSE